MEQLHSPQRCQALADAMDTIQMKNQAKDEHRRKKPARAAAKKPSFGPDRKGEASAGALASRDKKRSVVARRDGSTTR